MTRVRRGGVRHYGVYAPGRRSLCFGAKPTQRPKLEISRGGGKEGLREDRGSVDKGTQRGQSTTDSRRDQSA